MSIPKNVRKYREEKGFTQEELAERVDTDRSTISRIETGSIIPNAVLFRCIAQVLDVSMDELAKD